MYFGLSWVQALKLAMAGVVIGLALSFVLTRVVAKPTSRRECDGSADLRRRVMACSARGRAGSKLYTGAGAPTKVDPLTALRVE